MLYYGLKENVVQFALDLRRVSGNDSQWIMITRVAASVAYCVSIATGILSDDIVKEKAATYSLQPTDIWNGKVQDFKSRQR